MLVEKSQKLSIPEKHDIVSIYPDLSQWPALLAKNIQLTKDIPNKSENRAELLQIARDYTLNVLGVSCKSDAPQKIVATGHQAIWHHCGVWAKDLVTHEFAKSIGGGSLHLILDHDISDASMVLPKRNTHGGWCFQKVRVGPERKTVPLEFRKLPQKKCLSTFLDAVTKSHPQRLCNRFWFKSAILQAGEISRFRNVADLITYLQAILNIALGLEDILYLPVSLLSESDAFTDFVISIVQNAERFATSYNAGINNIENTTAGAVRRLSLDKQTGLVELPFWLVWPDGKRESLYVDSGDVGEIGIGTSSARLGYLNSASDKGKKEQLKNLLRQAGCFLRPKAVSLTLFVRLFLADWFVHGVGASQYEPVTDYIIENYYSDLSGLAYGVATCTMKLPVPENGSFTDEDISQLKHNLHDIKHNPERYISDRRLKKRAIVNLLRAKKEQIAQANDCSLPSDVRKAAWTSLLDTNRKLFVYVKGTAEMLENEVAECEQNKISREVFNSREFFFGLFPEDRLRKLAQSLTFAEHELCS